MDCKVVKRIPLSDLGEDVSDSMERRKDGPQQPRSELFIARVEQVSLGQAKEGSGSLMYWEQQYAQVEPLDGKAEDR